MAETQKQLAPHEDELTDVFSWEQSKPYRIADLNFNFRNEPMLKMLKKRASYLSSAKFDKARAIEHKMTELKNENYDEFVKPIYFYCTFMEDLGM